MIKAYLSRQSLVLVVATLLAACASKDLVPPEPTEADYQCAAEGNLSCVRKLDAGVQDCIIDDVARQLAACTKRCNSESGGDAETECGVTCSRDDKKYVGGAVAKCRPPIKTIPPP